MNDTACTWRMVHDLPHALPGSPFWHAREERLYWVDSALKLLWRLHPRSGAVEHMELPTEPGSVVPCRSGGLLLALRDGIHHLAGWHDVPRLIHAPPYDPAAQRFTEGRCDPWGRFWVGTQTVDEERADGGLYCLRPRTQSQPDLQLMERGATRSAGLAWSVDGRTLYWADGARHDIGRLAMTQPGQWPPVLGTPLPWAQFPRPGANDGSTAYFGRPGGMAMDQAGHCWVAMQESGLILALDARGQVVARLLLPALAPTALCFGGDDGRTLFVTTARLHRSAAELLRHPDSGAVFATELGTPGPATQMYWD